MNPSERQKHDRFEIEGRNHMQRGNDQNDNADEKAASVAILSEAHNQISVEIRDNVMIPHDFIAELMKEE